MARVDLDDAARDLYEAGLDDFVPRRTALVRQARSDGRRDLATSIAALRKPTVAAWLVNQLASRDVDGLQALLDVGAQLRDAQTELAGPRMQELTQRRHEVVRALVSTTRQLAAEHGQPASAVVLTQVEQTLRAAVADPAAARAVASGRLTRALTYAGLGEVGMSAATATPLKRPQRGPGTATKPVRTPKAAAAQKVETVQKVETTRPRDPAPRPQRTSQPAPGADLADLRAAASEAADAATADERRHEQALATQATLSARVESLQQELTRTRRELAAATKDAETARRASERTLWAARRTARELRKRSEP